jgi:hypothetical protein
MKAKYTYSSNPPILSPLDGLAVDSFKFPIDLDLDIGADSFIPSSPIPAANNKFSCDFFS